MTLFQLPIKPNRRAAARFIGKVKRALQAAVVEDRDRTGITQSKIAEAIGVHRSVISRELNGRQDITLGRVAELAWAMGREIDFDLKVPEATVGQNVISVVSGSPIETVVPAQMNAGIISYTKKVAHGQEKMEFMPTVARLGSAR